MRASRPHAPPTRILLLACLWVLATAATAAQSTNEAEMFWPQWRGPLATGAAPHGDPPVEWSETKNIRWKAEIPGRASASPIVWGDRVFVLTAIPTGDAVSSGSGGLFGGLLRRLGLGMSVEPTHVQQFTVLAIDRSSGQLVWQRTAREERPHEGAHPTGSWASGSAVTDGEHLWAFFGSRGLYCYDMQGNLIWEHDFGDLNIRLGFGEGNSPALYGDKIIINWDHEGQSFITALDKRTGKQIWRTNRDEMTSWSTPLVVEYDGGAQIVTSATDRVRSYDLETGGLIWESGGVTLNAIPSPVAGEGMVYATSGFRGSRLLAIRLSAARGDITGSNAVVWTLDRDTPYVPSPLLYGSTLYFLKSNSGILSAHDARTGRPHYRPQRLQGISSVYASPVAASGRVYVAGRDGTTLVITHGPEFEVLARNVLDDGVDASPAIVGNEIYLRGSRYLYCIAED